MGRGGRHDKTVAQARRRPSERRITADLVLIAGQKGQERVLLVESFPPSQQPLWSLPSKVATAGDDLLAIASAQQELLLDQEAGSLAEFGCYDGDGRDPDGPAAATVFVAKLRMTVPVRDDGRGGRWFSVNSLPELTLDHEAIIKDALEHIYS